MDKLKFVLGTYLLYMKFKLNAFDHNFGVFSIKPVVVLTACYNHTERFYAFQELRNITSCSLYLVPVVCI